MNALVSAFPKNNMPAIITAEGKLPPAVAESLHGSLAAFAVQRNLSDFDRAANLRSYRRAMVGFHPQLVISALDHLLLHNPRNPFPFTAQDLFERLEFEKSCWSGLVLEEMLGMDRRGRYKSSQGQKLPNFGGQPLTPACAMPDSFVYEVIAKTSGTWLHSFNNTTDRLLRSIPRSALAESIWEEVEVKRTAIARERQLDEERQRRREAHQRSIAQAQGQEVAS